jgi:MFS family permease
VLSMKPVLAGYTLALAVFIPISGWMADRFGTRRVFASVIALFTLGSVLCGLCGNLHLGGLIVRYLHWRDIFFVNVPIGVLGLILVYLHMPDFKEPKTPKLDLIGLSLLCLFATSTS